jgi:MOSC domain-containing protein YiiM
VRTQAKLLDKYMGTAAKGTVQWIGVRPERKGRMNMLDSVEAIENRGLVGDRSCEKSNGSARQVTLINAEDIEALARFLNYENIDPAVLRRNIVVSGLNLKSMRYQTLQVGTAVVEIGAHCHPCSRMEQALGKGALLAMYGYGGYCAKVLKSGVINLGDELLRLDRDDENHGAKGPDDQQLSLII